MKVNEYKVKSILEKIIEDMDRAFQLSESQECDFHIIAAMNTLITILDLIEFEEVEE